MIFPGFENDCQAIIIKMTFLAMQTYCTINISCSFGLQSSFVWLSCVLAALCALCLDCKLGALCVFLQTTLLLQTATSNSLIMSNTNTLVYTHTATNKASPWVMTECVGWPRISETWKQFLLCAAELVPQARSHMAEMPCAQSWKCCCLRKRYPHPSLFPCFPSQWCVCK